MASTRQNIGTACQACTPPSLSSATLLLSYLQVPGAEASLEKSVSPAWLQPDEWSCGYQMLRYFETRRRQHLGEIPVPTMTPSEWMQLGTQLIASMQQTHRRMSGAVPASSGSTPVPRTKKLTEPDSEAHAFERAASCKKCKERKSGPMKGHKGCKECMGSYFHLVSTRPVKEEPPDFD